MATYRPIVYGATGAYQPMPAGDTSVPDTIPKSARTGNRLQVLSDGLYVGNAGPQNVLYVAAAGSDTPGASVYKTLDYALSQLVAAAPSVYGEHNEINVGGTIALKAGETFTMTQRYNLHSRIAITFYGDPNFGDFNSPLMYGTTLPAVFETLQRPAVTPTATFDSTTGQWIVAGFTLTDASIHLLGLSLQIPGRPSPAPLMSAYGFLSDFLTSTGNQFDGCALTGTIVNKQDVNSVFGLLGVTPNAVRMALYGFASQFRIANAVVDASTAPTDSTLLLSRQYFIKMYADNSGINQARGYLEPTSANSSPGSAVLALSWSDVARQLAGGGNYNLPSSPPLLGASWGFARNWVYGITYNQQNYPLNVISGRQL